MSVGTAAASDVLFLGLDSSTQGLKATVIGPGLNIVYQAALNFDADLPRYGTEGGVHRHADGVTVTSPAIMWVEALDALLDRMQADGCPMRRIAAVSGSGQQHGSVWMKRGAREALRSLGAGTPLKEQLADAFAVADSPVWMDSSTTRECRALEEKLGGAQAVADLTGSRAYERFTGNQIAKIYRTTPEDYAATERILLVSSFIASLLAGDYAPIDTSDGSGMNLMDIRSRTWSRAALDATAPGLASRLGPVVPSHSAVGRLHRYFAQKYGLPADCRVLAFSGDNPCSLAGLRLQRVGEIAVSLGTSDTMFGSLSEPKPSGVEGHIFVNPVEPDAFMAMMCIKNGSLTREFIRDSAAGGRWETFERLIEQTAPGNGGKIGFYMREPEITPPIARPGLHRFDASGAAVDRFAPAEEVRAAVEGQFLCMRLHGANIGLKPMRILATGGASANKALLRVMADVFGVPVSVGDVPNSAALGAAYRALHGWRCEQNRRFVPFAEVMAAAPSFRDAAVPDESAHAVYERMLPRYAELERRVASVTA